MEVTENTGIYRRCFVFIFKMGVHEKHLTLREVMTLILKYLLLLLHMMHYNSTTMYKTGKQLTIPDTYCHTGNRWADQWNRQHPPSSKQSNSRPYGMQSCRWFNTNRPEYVVMVSDKVKAYYVSRHHLTVSEGLVLYNDRRVVPQKMRSEILQRIHDLHQGTVM